MSEAEQKPAPKADNSPFIFFGEVDKRNGKVVSEYPGWYYERLLDELNDDIEKKEREVKRGIISDDKKERLMARVAEMKTKRDKILESMPKITERNIDRYAKLRKEAGRLITDSHFTLSQERKRLVDPYQEAKRMSTPCIEVRGELYDACKAANVKISSDGKVSRDGLTKVWKIVSKAMGEIPNSAALKKD